MTRGAAEKFAQGLLTQFGKEHAFQFELPEGHHIELVAEALKNMGCKVDYDLQANLVRVKVAGAESAT